MSKAAFFSQMWIKTTAKKKAPQQEIQDSAVKPKIAWQEVKVRNNSEFECFSAKYESYQMDCFATSHKSSLQIWLFWRDFEKSQTRTAAILLSFPVPSKNQGKRQFFFFVFNSWENLQKSQGYSERNCKFLYSNNESHESLQWLLRIQS